MALRSVPEIVKWLGGPSRAAAWAGYTYPSGVSYWLATQRIPPGYHYALHLKAQHEGRHIPPEVFGFNKDGSPLVRH
jgi:hypothetical protein